MTFFVRRLVAYLPKLNHRIWILMVGRLLSQLGTGFVLFYAPIFFVNQVGLSTVAVGIGLGSESISGVFGRILGGTLADSPRWGRRKTLLAATAISALADLVLAFSHDFPSFLLGNLLMGLGIGLYWPATESVVADLTTGEER
ncbi:MAG TPA: MFS transporter, partial [Allocoleopsis sp.]